LYSSLCQILYYIDSANAADDDFALVLSPSPDEEVTILIPWAVQL